MILLRVFTLTAILALHGKVFAITKNEHHKDERSLKDEKFR